MDSSDAKITVSHTITNTLDKDIECAAWALSVMDKNSVIVVPQPTHDTGLLANRSISLWPYTDMTDKRLFFGKKFVASKQDPEIENALKYGITNTAGKIAVFNHGTVFVKEYKSEHFDSVYPDFGVSTEVYANGDFTEAETLSPLKKISKGESITHVESWSLAEFDEKIEFTNDSLENLIGRIF